MPTIHDLKQSRFLSKAELAKPILVTIAGYDQLNVAMESQPVEMRWVLKFHEQDKAFVLNSTNGQIIAQITGSEDFDDWISKTIVLYFDPNISFGGQLKGGIRARAPRNAPLPAVEVKPLAGANRFANDVNRPGAPAAPKGPPIAPPNPEPLDFTDNEVPF